MEVDMAGGVHMLIDRLAEMGCRKVAFFDETMSSYSSKRSLVYFKEGLESNGMEYSDDRIFIGKGRLKGSFAQLRPVFDEKDLPFDAIFCLDYRTANEISHLIWGHKTRFGTDVVLATSRSYSYYKMPIRAVYVDFDSREVAYQGVNLLLSNIQQGQAGRPGRTLISPIIEALGPAE
jgi:DNA-binding LacI/PurR family transcriptional regulator